MDRKEFMAVIKELNRDEELLVKIGKSKIKVVGVKTDQLVEDFKSVMIGLDDAGLTDEVSEECIDFFEANLDVFLPKDSEEKPPPKKVLPDEPVTKATTEGSKESAEKELEADKEQDLETEDSSLSEDSFQKIVKRIGKSQKTPSRFADSLLLLGGEVKDIFKKVSSFSSDGGFRLYTTEDSFRAYIRSREKSGWIFDWSKDYVKLVGIK